MFLFGQTNFIRKSIVWLVESPWFDFAILLAILGNSLSLAMYDYDDREAKTAWNQVMENIGLACSIIFIVECALKIIAMGFFLHF